MADTGGWENVILPNAFAPPGEAIQARINNQNALVSRQGQAYELEQERRAKELERQQKQADDNRLYNINRLRQETDPQKLTLGTTHANDIKNKQLKDVYDSLVDYAAGDKADFEIALQQKVGEFHNWENKFQQDYDYSIAKVNDILKNNPNLSDEQAKEIVKGQIESKYLQQDNEGNFIRKPSDQIDDRQDPTAILNDPKMQGYIAKGGGDVLKNIIQSDKLHQEDYSTYAANKGFVNSKDYNIGVSGLKELTHDANGEPVLKMKTEDMSLGNGVDLKMIPKDTFDAYMSNPQFSSAFYKLWNPVSAKIEDNFAQKGQTIDPHSEEMLQRDFLRKYIEDNNIDLSFVQSKEKNVIPRPPSVNISFGQQQRDQAAQIVDGITTSIRNGDEKALKEWTSFFKRGNTSSKLEEAFFVPGSDKKKVGIQYYIIDSKGKKKFQEKYFEADDPYLRDKIIAEYQQDIGSTVPVENLPFANNLPQVQLSGAASGNAPPKHTTKKGVLD